MVDKKKKKRVIRKPPLSQGARALKIIKTQTSTRRKALEDAPARIRELALDGKICGMTIGAGKGWCMAPSFPGQERFRETPWRCVAHGGQEMYDGIESDAKLNSRLGLYRNTVTLQEMEEVTDLDFSGLETEILILRIRLKKLLEIEMIRERKIELHGQSSVLDLDERTIEVIVGGEFPHTLTRKIERLKDFGEPILATIRMIKDLTLAQNALAQNPDKLNPDEFTELVRKALELAGLAMSPPKK